MFIKGAHKDKYCERGMDCNCGASENVGGFCFCTFNHLVKVKYVMKCCAIIGN